MSGCQRTSLFVVRVALGWLYLYAGMIKVFDPAWSSAGYLKKAQVFGGLYAWLATAGMIRVTDFVNEWGLTLLGVSLILGVFVRLSSLLGILIMVLYYLPQGFPRPNAHAYIVDEHIIYIGVLFVLFAWRAGRIRGLDALLARSPRLG